MWDVLSNTEGTGLATALLLTLKCYLKLYLKSSKK